MLRGFFLGAGEVDQLEREFFPVAALGAQVADAVLYDLIFAGQLIGAVFEVETEVVAVGEGRRERSGK